jgi:hypothetical protein
MALGNPLFLQVDMNGQEQQKYNLGEKTTERICHCQNPLDAAEDHQVEVDVQNDKIDNRLESRTSIDIRNKAIPMCRITEQNQEASSVKFSLLELFL